MTILEALFPIVAIAALAWLVAHKEIVSDSDVKGFEKITFNFLIPCMLFHGTATMSFPEVMDWNLMWAYYLAIFIIYLLGMLIAFFRYGLGQARLSVIGMGCAYPNVTILGIPICLELLGEEAFVPIFMLIAVNNLLIFSFGIIVAELKREEGTALRSHLWTVFRGVVKNPISGSLLVGGVVNLAGIAIYSPLMESLELISRAAIPAALIYLGAGMNRYHIRGEIPMAMSITLMKLMVLPALVWTLTEYVFEMDRLWTQTAVLLSCMPVGISVYVFSIRYRCCENLVASAIVLSCVLSVFSISFYAFLLGL
jgi:malonate transporter